MADYTAPILLLTFLCTCIILLFKSFRSSSGTTNKLPPGPRPVPIFGNFFALGEKPHHSVTALAQKYGPLMTLKLGSVVTIAVSSADTAKQVLQKHDHVLSNRFIPDAATSLNHNQFSMLWLPVDAHWRNLRKIWTIQLFTTQRLDASQGLRMKKVGELLDHIDESCKIGQAVDIGRTASTTSLNLLSNTLLSLDLAHYRSNLSQEFKDLVWGVIEESGRPNLADYIPVLKRIDPQGVKRRTINYLKKLFAIFDDIVNERRRLRSSSTNSSTHNDMLDALLDLAEDDENMLTKKHVKHILLDLFVAGTDTTSSTVEWAMAELLRNPTTMYKVKKELQEILNKDEPVQESDIPNLPYLQAVVKETLRLHPAAAFLFHKADQDVEINGFTVPKDAQILVNSWAVCLDPDVWSKPNSFVPERFLEDKFFDIKGGDFEFIPFGAGRRKCPGMPLGNRMVHLMLASLLHSFDWKLKDGMKPEDMDMTDKFGIVLTKAKPLLAICFSSGRNQACQFGV